MTRLQTFHGPSMREALAKVKAELGPEAMVVGTRTIERGGVLGRGSKRVIEITAAAPEEVGGPQPCSGRERRKGDGRLAAYGPHALSHDADADQRPQDSQPRRPDGDLREEVNAIKEMVAEILSRQSSRKEADGSALQEPCLPQSLLDAYTRLIGEQVACQWADDLFGRVAADLGEGAGADPAKVRSRLVSVLEGMLPTSPGIELNPARRGRIVAFVGPTGEGKTTTIAKIASQVKQDRRGKVALVTTDVRRPGCSERLRAYAGMLEVPFEATEEPARLGALRQRHGDCHIILLDTPGCSVIDKAGIDELTAQLSAAGPDEIHLVLSATTQPAAAHEALSCFHALGADRVVVSKVDEAVGLGVLLALAEQLETRLSYLTTGQHVPQDIEIASARRVAQMLLQDRPVTGKGRAC